MKINICFCFVCLKIGLAVRNCSSTKKKNTNVSFESCVYDFIEQALSLHSSLAIVCHSICFFTWSDASGVELLHCVIFKSITVKTFQLKAFQLRRIIQTFLCSSWCCWFSLYCRLLPALTCTNGQENWKQLSWSRIFSRCDTLWTSDSTVPQSTSFKLRFSQPVWWS